MFLMCIGQIAVANPQTTLLHVPRDRLNNILVQIGLNAERKTIMEGREL